LHNDRGGDIGSLDGDVIEIVGDGYTECPEHEAVGEIAGRKFDALPTLPCNEKRKQYE